MQNYYKKKKKKGMNEAERCVFLGGERNTPSSYSSDDDSSFMAVDAEGQMARFVTKTLRVCSGLVVLTYCT